MKLTPTELKNNYDKLIEFIKATFPDRPQLYKLYKDYEERVTFDPASTIEHYHNAFVGGYCDHILRVIEYSRLVYKMYEKLGLDVSNFTLNELLFAALNHDLGKLGLPADGHHGYDVNQSEWHRKNQGKIYDVNKHSPFGLIQDKSLFILQHYLVQMTYNEYNAIRIHDGMYDKANEAYYLTNQPHSKLRSNIAMILHQADIMAARFEWERWAKESNSINLSAVNCWDIAANVPVNVDKKSNSSLDDFNNIFG